MSRAEDIRDRLRQIVGESLPAEGPWLYVNGDVVIQVILDSENAAALLAAVGPRDQHDS